MQKDNGTLNHKKQTMDREELEKEIEKKKRLIADYIRIAPILEISSEEQERQVNQMLDDLAKLLNQKG